MDYKKLANLLFPNVTETVDALEKKYPKRNLEEGAIVTRFAPSPTGIDVHFGHLFNCFIASTVAHQSNGVYYLRIEDTDQKRKVEGAVETIIKTLNTFNINFDEGRTIDGNDFGNYGPYKQSERKNIYQAVAKMLVENGLAYPCFCKEEDLNKIRSYQKEHKLTHIGYYGEFAKCRNLTYEEIEENIKNGKKWVLRFKCSAKPGDRMSYDDYIKGVIEQDANINDVIIIKEDGLPPYNFAHVCDDHFMRTNMVMRGEEYSGVSTTEHIQLFNACGFEVPRYAHNPYILKLDPETGNAVKLSKSKHREASVSFYLRDGYPVDAVVDYMYLLANSDFEKWREENPTSPVSEYTLKISNLSKSGSVFDIDKLNNISKNRMALKTATQVYEETYAWANEHNKEWAELLNKHKDFAIKMFNIDRETAKPRKDITTYLKTIELYNYFFNEYFYNFNIENFALDESFNNYENVENVLKEYLNSYNENLSHEDWFAKIKEFSSKIGYATDNKEYKKNPEKYLGNVANVCGIIRVAITSQNKTPDLYEICKLLGKEELENRINYFLEILKNK